MSSMQNFGIKNISKSPRNSKFFRVAFNSVDCRITPRSQIPPATKLSKWVSQTDKWFGFCFFCFCLFTFLISFVTFPQPRFAFGLQISWKIITNIIQTVVRQRKQMGGKAREGEFGDRLERGMLEGGGLERRKRIRGVWRSFERCLDCNWLWSKAGLMADLLADLDRVLRESGVLFELNLRHSLVVLGGFQDRICWFFWEVFSSSFGGI
jgi:hypothetical protein